MEILLLGGTGVLSTDIAKIALSMGHQVYLMNRGNRKERIAEGAVELVADIRSEESMQAAIKKNTWDVIIDFLSFVPKDLELKMRVFQNRCAQYVFISSATAYHKKSEEEIITEQTKIGGSNWYYANQKALCEKALPQLAMHYNMQYTIVRPYVTYGETRIPFPIIPLTHQWTLVNRILCGKPIVVVDGGNAVCTLTHTVDFAKNILGLLMNPEAYGEAFHITSDETMTWKEVAFSIGNAVGKQPILADIPMKVYVDIVPEDADVLLYDKGTSMRFSNEKIKRISVGFSESIPFSEGIKKSIIFYKNHPEWQKISYEWDGLQDYTIEKYFGKKSLPADVSKRSISVYGYPYHLALREKVQYYIGRNNFLRCFVQRLQGIEHILRVHLGKIKRKLKYSFHRKEY